MNVWYVSHFLFRQSDARVQAQAYIPSNTFNYSAYVCILYTYLCTFECAPFVVVIIIIIFCAYVVVVVILLLGVIGQLVGEEVYK